MVSKLLRLVGVLALLGVGAVGGYGLLVVKDRVRIVVTDDAEHAVDRTALLADDVQALRRDVQALADALAADAERRHGELEDLRDAASRRTPGADAAPLPSTAPPVASPTPAGSSPADPSTPTGPGGAKEAPRKGFLSFELPSRTFVFDREQDFEVVPELSRVGFDAKSTLHDFSGVTSQVAGRLRANLAAKAGGWSGEVTCAAASLATGVDGRDDAMREHLDTANHAQIRFAITGFTPVADGIDAQKQTVRGEVAGTMSIRGVDRPLTVPVEVGIDEGKRVVVTGQTTLRLPDYGVPVPNQLGVVRMQEEVAIWVALRLRVAAGGQRAR